VNDKDFHLIEGKPFCLTCGRAATRILLFQQYSLHCEYCSKKDDPKKTITFDEWYDALQSYDTLLLADGMLAEIYLRDCVEIEFFGGLLLKREKIQKYWEEGKIRKV